MKLNNSQVLNFVNKIKLKKENMPKYREQINNLKDKLQVKIDEDKKTDISVKNFTIGGSWKKGPILRHTGENPIDIDLILFIEGEDNLKDDVEKIHDYVVKYLKDIYPSKENSDIVADGKTKSIKVKFVGTGLEVDIVPVVSVKTPADFVWQPERGGGGQYITSVTKQLDFSAKRKESNPSYVPTVRALKWWRNYKELKPEPGIPGLSSYHIELIVSHLEINQGLITNLEDGLIRFFKFVSENTFPTISFASAINKVPSLNTTVFIGDPTNNENNTAHKIDKKLWDEIKKEANDAFESLTYAQARNYEGDTIEEWKRVFGPSFNINEEE